MNNKISFYNLAYSIKQFFKTLIVKPLMLFVLLVLVGCSNQDAIQKYPNYYDFVENFRLADVHHEVTLIDFGTPSARKHMLEGWWGDEGSSNASFVWGFGDKSGIEFFLSQVSEFDVTFRCAPFRFPESPTQTLSIVINGQKIEQIRLEPGLTLYQIVVPKNVLLAGKNRIEFMYAYSSVPKKVKPGANDVRTLAVSWDYIRFGGLAETLKLEPYTNEKTGSLFIPFGTQLDYYILLPQESFLTFAEVTLTGEQGNSLRIVLESGLREQLVENFSSSAKFQAIPLAGDASQITRLSFQALLSTGLAADSGGVTVSRPTIHVQHTRESALASRRPNVIIYLIDALRADHLGCYGYHKPISPNIDDFSKDAIIFKNAIAQSFWTKPTVASILTGLGPESHGVNGIKDALPAEVITLPELLRASGYHTAAFVANAMVGNILQLDHGFLDYVDLSGSKKSTSYHQLSDEINRSVFSWLETNSENQPFFLYVHTLDPHGPYLPPAKFKKRFANEVTDMNVGSSSMLSQLNRNELQVTSELINELVSLYDAEIASNDHNFGLFIKELKKRNLFDESLIILVADHGEEFYEHGSWEHGSLHAEVLNIPLIVKFPKSSGTKHAVVESIAQQIDIFPTIVDYIDLDVQWFTTGKSLLDLALHKVTKRAVFSGTLNSGSRSASVISGDWKLICKEVTVIDDANVELYNLDLDPHEKTNVLQKNRKIASRLLSLIEEHEQSSDKKLRPQKVVLDQEFQKKIRSLGYIK